MMPTLRIEASENGERLDVALARAYPRYSRSFMQKVMKQGGVTLRGVIPPPSYRVTTGQIFDVEDFEKRGIEPKTLIKLGGPLARGSPTPPILFEDDELLVIDKPAGWVVHPATGHRGDTLVDWAREHLGRLAENFADPDRLGLVHRLDKDTSGVLLLAKNVRSQEAVSRQFRERTVKKTYSAFIEGVPSALKGVIAAPLGRSRKEPRRMAISGNGRPSETYFEVKEALKEVSQVTLYPKTGRTHQIRVHVAAIGHPIVGDLTYGARIMANERFGITRTLLHAESLEIRHPETRRPIEFKAPWPADFTRAQKVFQKAFLLAALALGVGGQSVRAAEDSPAPTPHHAHHASTASTGPSLSSQLRAVRKDVAAQKEALDALTTQVAALQTALDELNTSERIQNLEKAISEINGKSVGTSMSAEEAKTQALDSVRKIKNFQEVLDQLRDKVDRLQSQAAQWRSQQTEAPVPVDTNGKRP